MMDFLFPSVRFLLLGLLAVGLCGCVNSKARYSRALSSENFNEVFRDAASQYKLLASHLPAGKFPKNYNPEKKEYEWSSSQWWCSGFYPGSLLFLYEETGDKELYNEAQRMLKLLEKEQFNTSTHDLGFMMFCSFGNANRMEPNKELDSILINSARSLSTRFNPKVGCIRSWDSDPSDFLVIIDNMMNLELLFWASKKTGDSSFYKLAVTHANTTIKNHFRDNNSSYHVVNYDPETGVVKEKRTAQGYSNESAWARGQAWGLYGYVVTYRETRNPVYLKQAQNIAAFLLGHRNLPADKIPYWDFDAPNIPSELRDASAAAIIASSLLELQQYSERDKAKLYIQTAEIILEKLSAPAYRAAAGTNGGFILQHGVGHLPAGTEVDVALTYADYYYLEALKRYKKLK